MHTIKTINDLDLTDKRVLVRVDFNVPLDAQGKVTDDTRITATLPTLRSLIEQKAKVILVSHLGRPDGQPDPRYTLKPVAAALSQKLGQPVLFAPDCIGAEAEQAAENLDGGNVLLLENLRFHKGETDNDPEFSAALARLAEVYVNDAFGAAHRSHASTVGVTAHLAEKAAGLLMVKELEFLGQKTEQPERPFVVILGGAKVSDKIGVINALLDKADTILIGGAMAYTFKIALGQSIGESPSEPDKVDLAQAAMDKAKAKGVQFLLPEDHLSTDSLDFGAGTVGTTRVFETNVDSGWESVDIGPKTIARFTEEIAKAKTILWNGPMGIFEIEVCSKGTFEVARAVAANKEATSIIGGGDSVTAINQSGCQDAVSFISTGGGASLEFLEGKTLPGVQALSF